MNVDPTTNRPTFEKVDNVPCLYRYTGNGVYYGLVKHEGKQVRKSLSTTDKTVAKRLLADFQRDLGKVDLSQGKLTLKVLTERYLGTIASLAHNTTRKRKACVARFLAEFSLGADAQVAKVKPSDIQTWLASYNFGYASYNLYAQVVREMFAMAVADKIIPTSPAAAIKSKKVVKPIRITPSFDDFNNIVAEIRNQSNTYNPEGSADFIAFLGLMGVGQAEASAVQKQHINITTKQVTFFRAKTKTPYVVPLYGQAEALVKKLIGKPGMKPIDPLFPVSMEKSRSGEGSSTRDCKRSLLAACKRLRLPAYTQRSLRRMFITRCIEKGIDVKVIAQWQGHQDGGKLILGTYSHVRNVHAEEMAKLLAV